MLENPIDVRLLTMISAYLEVDFVTLEDLDFFIKEVEKLRPLAIGVKDGRKD